MSMISDDLTLVTIRSRKENEQTRQPSEMSTSLTCRGGIISDPTGESQLILSSLNDVKALNDRSQYVRPNYDLKSNRSIQL
jgi:hypothetical protein